MNTYSSISKGRIIADHGPVGGPLLLVTCLIHGNEPAGETAIRQVIEALEPAPSDHLRGRVVVLRGNLQAAANKSRYIEADLNRIFPTVVAPSIESTHMVSEFQERDELISLIERLAEEHPVEERYFVDLHTTSSETLPYLSLPSGNERLIKFARKFPLHIVSGFYRYVPGSIDRYLHEQGFTGFACEGGQHSRDAAVTSMTALFWMMLEETGCLAPGASIADRSSLDEAHAVLDGFVVGPPKVFEFTHRHALNGNEGFVMEPGFANFHEVKRDEIIARDNNGPIRAPTDGNLLMPLYQTSGNDGFFLVEERPASRGSE